MADPKQHKHEVGLQRPHGFYISDNELVDKLAAEIGIYAFGVYHMLMRRAENRAGASVSLREISQYLAISKNTAAKALTRLKEVGLVQERPAKDRSTPPMYLIVHAKDVVMERTSNPHYPQPCPKSGTQATNPRVPYQGHDVSHIKDTRVPHQGHPCPISGTLNKEVNKTKQVQDNAPLPPSRGVTDHDGDVREEKPKAKPDEKPFDLAGGLKRLGAKTSTQSGRTLAQTRASFNGVLQDLHGALVDASLANAHKGKPGLRDGAEEFQRYFADVALEDYEAAEGTSEQIVLVVRTRDPAVTRRGFTIYRARIERSMLKYFGRVVQVRFEEA